MNFKISFEIFLFLFHTATSFKFLNEFQEDIPAVTYGSVFINAEADKRFKVCSLNRNWVEICQVSHNSETVSCDTNYKHVIYNDFVSKWICKFVVPNVQDQGNKQIITLLE
jgi:hypothetical protein